MVENKGVKKPDGKYCNDCKAVVEINLCRWYPKYQRKGYREMILLIRDKENGMLLRDTDCLKYGVPERFIKDLK